MKMKLRHIIIVGTLLFFNSGQLFANVFYVNVNQQSNFNGDILASGISHEFQSIFTIKNPIKEVFRKGFLSIDNEEEEDGTASKKTIEKSTLVSALFATVSPNSFSSTDKSLSLYNAIIPINSYNSLYLLFEVFLI
jgi:hypothetical protein